MLDKLNHITEIKQGYDTLEGYYYYVEIPDEMLDSLGWNEKTDLNVDIKMNNKGNVLVISRK
jgi:hypothetical protein